MFNRQPQHISEVLAIHPLIAKGIALGKLPSLAKVLNNKNEEISHE